MRRNGRYVMPVSALETNAAKVMSSPPVVISESVSLKEAAKLMIDKNIGCLPVVDQEGRLSGVVTERTFQVQIAGVRPDSALSPERRVLEELYVDGPDRTSLTQERFAASHSRPVREFMLLSPLTVERQAPLWKVADSLLKNHMSHVIVVHDGKPVGVIARHDLLRAFASR